jgi:hypothetical protein
MRSTHCTNRTIPLNHSVSAWQIAGGTGDLAAILRVLGHSTQHSSVPCWSLIHHQHEKNGLLLHAPTWSPIVLNHPRAASLDSHLFPARSWVPQISPLVVRRPARCTSTDRHRLSRHPVPVPVTLTAMSVPSTRLPACHLDRGFGSLPCVFQRGTDLPPAGVLTLVQNRR